LAKIFYCEAAVWLQDSRGDFIVGRRPHSDQLRYQVAHNICTFVGNGKVFADNIQNFSMNAYRRVDLVAQLNHSVDSTEAIELLKDRLKAIPNVIDTPAPDVEILQFTPMGPVLAVRPYTNNEHYWQVYFDTNRLIRNAFGEAGFPAPGQFVFLKNQNGGEAVTRASALGTH